MKIISVMPVKNEAWIIDRTIKALCTFCDKVIIADQRSDDGTKEIISRYDEKVDLIDNKLEGHGTEVRWKLLDAAREYDGCNYILTIDADEFFSSNIMNPSDIGVLLDIKPGTGIKLPWIQLWRSANLWRNDNSIWSNSWKSFGFRDDRRMQYGKIIYPNDHNPTIPECRNILKFDHIKVLHFQFVHFERMLCKQRWYRVREALELGPENHRKINEFYCHTKDERNMHLESLPPSWTDGWKAIGIDFQTFEESPLYWYDVEVLQYFGQKGVDYFAEIDIWDVDWEEKRNIAISQGYMGMPKERIVDPRTAEQQLYHSYLNRFFRIPPWRNPKDLWKVPGRWLRFMARSMGIRRHHLNRIGIIK